MTSELETTTTLLRGDEAIGFARQWQDLDAPTEFVTPSWITASWRHLPELGAPLMAVASDRSGWCALALVERTDARPHRIAIAGAPLGDEHDVVVSPGANFPQLVQSLVRALESLADNSIIVLNAVRTSGVLGQELAARQWLWRTRSEAAPICYAGQVTVNAESHSRRMRRLSRLGCTVVDTLSGSTLTAGEVERFVSRRLASWTRRERIRELPDAERLPGFARFLGAMASELAARDLARLLVLRVGDARAAESLHVGPRYDSLMYMINYDPEFASYSPGRVLFEHTLLGLDSSSPRLRTGRGDESYKLAAGAKTAHVLTAELQEGR